MDSDFSRGFQLDVRLLRGFLTRPRDERWTILRTVTVVVPVKLALASRGYRPTVRLLERFARTSGETLEEKRTAAMLAQRVMTRLPLHFTCLERSLVVWWLVGGEPSAEIRFGVQPAEDMAQPRFHAWVEIDGEALDGDLEDISAFIPFTSVSSAQLGRFD